jgi:tRNA threonylcarbamoyladenosine biosynthesis protein TsaB
MTILAFEFSSDRRSVALARDGRCLAEAVQQTGDRATNALGLVEQALAAASLGRDEIETIAVGLGPGSYTGIRAAIAVAQGWQLAAGVKLIGVSSAEAIAAQARARGMSGRVHILIDAQRGEYYLGTWDISGNAQREVSPLRIVSATEATALQQAGETLAGPAAERVLFPGAADVAGLAALRNDYVSGEKLAPIYLRETTFVKAVPARTL